MEWPSFIYFFWCHAWTRRRVAHQCGMYTYACARPPDRADEPEQAGCQDAGDTTYHRGDVARYDHHNRMNADPRRAPTPSMTSPHAIPASHGTCHRPPGVAPYHMPMPSGLAPAATHRQAPFWPLLTCPSSYSLAPALIHAPRHLFTHPGTYSHALALIHTPQLLFTHPGSYSRVPMCSGP